MYPFTLVFWNKKDIESAHTGCKTSHPNNPGKHPKRKPLLSTRCRYKASLIFIHHKHVTPALKVPY